MALNDLITVSLTQPEVDEITAALQNILDIIKPKSKNLTPAERQMYGRVRYEFEVWIEKCRMYMMENPSFVPNYIDMVAFNDDYTSRDFMKPIEGKLKMLYEMFDDTFVLLGHDLYTNCIAFYNALKVAAKNNVPGSTSIYNDLKQQFPGGKKPGGTIEPPPPPEG